MNIAYMIYLGEALPHCSPNGRYMEVLNETLLQLITYHMLLVTFRNRYKSNAGDFQEAMETVSQLQYDDILGWSMIGHIVVLQAVNFLVIVINTIIGIKRYFYLRKLKKQSEASITKVEQVSSPIPQISTVPSVDNFLIDQAPSVDNFLIDQAPVTDKPLKVKKKRASRNKDESVSTKKKRSSRYKDDSVSAQIELISEVEEDSFKKQLIEQSHDNLFARDQLAELNAGFDEQNELPNYLPASKSQKQVNGDSLLLATTDHKGSASPAKPRPRVEYRKPNYQSFNEALALNDASVVKDDEEPYLPVGNMPFYKPLADKGVPTREELPPKVTSQSILSALAPIPQQLPSTKPPPVTRITFKPKDNRSSQPTQYEQAMLERLRAGIREQT